MPLLQTEPALSQVRVIELLDVVRLVSHGHCAPVFLHQAEGLTGIEVGLNNHGTPRDQWGQHDLDGAAGVEKGLWAEETVFFGKAQWLTAMISCSQHGGVVQHGALRESGGPRRELN